MNQQTEQNQPREEVIQALSAATTLRRPIRAIDLEPVDQKLENLCAMLEMLAGGASFTCGDSLERVLCCILDLVRDARAALDAIAG